MDKKSRAKIRKILPGKKTIFVLFLAFYFLFFFLATNLLANKAVVFAENYLTYEKQVHSQKLRNHLDEVRLAMREFEWLENYSQSLKRLTMDDKRDIMKDLRELEAKSQNIFIDHQDFRYDNTLQVAEKLGLIDISEISGQYAQARDLNLYLDRFVRSVENAIVFETYPQKDEVEIMLKNYKLARKKVDKNN